MNRKSLKPTKGSSGFSLLELLIAMSITLAVLVAASTLLVSSLRIRTRENTRSEALAATQRALNILSREIANSGYGLADNGIIAADSGVGSIRIRANLDNDTTLNEPDEDVRYVFQGVPNNVIVRFDNFVAPPGNVVVLANNITNLTFKYYDLNGAQTTDYTTVERIRMDVTVDLPAGPQQPASVVHLQSDIALRNAKNTLEQF